MNLEELNQAADSAVFARDHLRQALKTASAVEALIIIPLIGRAAELERDIRALDSAAREVTP